MKPSRILGLTAVVAALALFGCGGDEGGAQGETASARTGATGAVSAETEYVKKLNAICRAAIAETEALGREFMRSPPTGDGVEVTTKGLVAPGMRIRDRMATRVRSVPAPNENSGKFLAYTQLFDPMASITRERLRAGQAGDRAKAGDLETLMVELGDEQEQAARNAGLETCSKDFIAAALNANNAR